MAGNGRTKTILTVAIAVASVLLIVCLIAGISTAYGNATTFGVTVNGRRYERNAGGLVLGKVSSVLVTSPSGTYDVSVRTRSPDTDFAFLVGEETYMWSETVYADFTSGFGIAKSDDGFTLTYDDLTSVLSGALGCPAEELRVPDVPTDGDLFGLTVTDGSDSIRLGFTLEDLGGNANVESVSLDVTEIVF